MNRTTRLGILVLVFLTHSPAVVWAQVPRVTPEGKLPDDVRLKDLRSLNSYFPFEPSRTPEEWARRKEQVQRHILVSLGLWPMPTKTPANAVIHGKVDRDDYTVERAFFESFPGFYVTGSLYRPKNKSGKLPGVLCPHGHWANGRFYDVGDRVKDEIQAGGEEFEEGGRSPLQARCVHLARMGCVVFHYDMIGYADSVQITQDIAHDFRKQRPDLNTLENWGLFSTQAETHAQSVMGMQTYNSIRALDFLLDLPDVDPKRIGVTGASGGGTQTFMLGAIDARPHVAFPAVMVSTEMQGGCTCENCSNLRVGTGNIEFAAMFAPRPLGMTAANDWTKKMETKGFPELKKHYAVLGAPDNVHLKAALQFGHNYNLVGRTAMYELFNKQLDLGFKEPIRERDYKRLSIDEMTVWSGEHKKPESGPEVERKVLNWWTKDSDAQLAKLTPRDSASAAQYRKIIGGAVDAIIGRSQPAADTLKYDEVVERADGDRTIMAGMLRNTSREEAIPVAFVHPNKWNGQVVIWLQSRGKSGLFDAKGGIAPPILKLVENGTSVVGVDLLYQGESLADGRPLVETPKVAETREFAGYTFGYNPTVFASRVHDVLTAISFIKNHEMAPKRIDLVGLDGLGPIAAIAAAQARGTLDRIAVDTQGFRFGKLTSFRDVNFLPGAAKYGDLPGVLALLAPNSLWIAGESSELPLVQATYSAAGQSSRMSLHAGPAGSEADAVVKFLTPR